MSSKPKRLLTRLDTAIAAAADPFAADCLRAERACYLARQGHHDRASAELEAIRARYAARPNPSISAWLSLADGLMSHFTDLGLAARDKMRRAHALSAAGRLLPLHALSSAWLAHMDYTRHDVDSMVRHLGQALLLAQADHHTARSRANLVAALAYHLAGRPDLAQPWYARARTHANAEGDDATISAILFNMASSRLHNLRQAVLGFQASAPHDGEHALIGADSTVNFDQMLGTVSLQSLLPLVRAHILSLQGEAAPALALYEAHLDKAQGMARMLGYMLSDQAWCRLQVGQIDAARVDALAAEADPCDETQIDDRAAMHSRLAQVFAGLGNREAAQRHEALARTAWNDFRTLQGRMVELLSGVGANGPL